MDPTNPTLYVIGVFSSNVMALWCTFLKKALWRYGCFQKMRYGVMKDPPRPPYMGVRLPFFLLLTCILTSRRLACCEIWQMANGQMDDQGSKGQ